MVCIWCKVIILNVTNVSIDQIFHFFQWTLPPNCVNHLQKPFEWNKQLKAESEEVRTEHSAVFMFSFICFDATDRSEAEFYQDTSAPVQLLGHFDKNVKPCWRKTFILHLPYFLEKCLSNWKKKTELTPMEWSRRRSYLIVSTCHDTRSVQAGCRIWKWRAASSVKQQRTLLLVSHPSSCLVDNRGTAAALRLSIFGMNGVLSVLRCDLFVWHRLPGASQCVKSLPSVTELNSQSGFVVLLQQNLQLPECRS